MEPGSDEDARFALKREWQNVDVVARFCVQGEPVSKARARFTRGGHAYTPEKTKLAEEVMAWGFRQAAPRHVADDEWTYGVFGVFFAGTRQRRDVDNMIKLICDALNGVAWKDDVQVEEVSGRRGDGTGKPRTEILIYRIGKVYRPTRDCAHCGAPFRTYPSLPNARCCSDKCRLGRLAAARVRKCEQCGSDFDGKHPSHETKFCSRQCKTDAGRVTLDCDQCGVSFSKQRCHKRAKNYCSAECAATSARLRRKAGARGVCTSCGGPVSKKMYVQCRACRITTGGDTSGKPVVAGLGDGA